MKKYAYAFIGAIIALVAFSPAITAGQTAPLHSLVPLVQGINTYNNVTLNSPLWGLGINLPATFITTVGTTTGGTLGTSTPQYYFQVQALDGVGTTTPSLEVASPVIASTSTALTVSWRAITGASNYQVLFGSTPGGESSCLIAGATTTLTVSTTTSATACTPNKVNTAFIDKINPISLSWFNGGNVGIGTTTPNASLEVYGSFSLAGVSATTTASVSGALTVGVCNTATSTISGATMASSTSIVTTPQTYPGDGVIWESYVLSPTQVVTKECGLKSVTPTATAFNIRAIN